MLKSDGTSPVGGGGGREPFGGGGGGREPNGPGGGGGRGLLPKFEKNMIAK